MATHVHLPSVPYLSELITRKLDGTLDFSKADEAFVEWHRQFNVAINKHNQLMQRPWWFRLLTGYRNPRPIQLLSDPTSKTRKSH